MKKIILGLLTLTLSFCLAACGGNGTTSSMNSSTGSDASSGMITSSDNSSSGQASSTEDSSGTNGENTVLKDGKYTAEGKNYDDEGYKPYVELTVKNGKITEIDCDAIDKDGDFKKDEDDMKSWVDKIMLFEKEVVAKGLEKIKFNDDGTVTGIDGMDLNVGEYSKLIEEAINKAKK